MTETELKLQELEEKLHRAAEVFQKNVAERRALEREVEKLRTNSKRNNDLEDEVLALRREREEVRMRIEKLLKQIDSLTKVDSAG